MNLENIKPFMTFDYAEVNGNKCSKDAEILRSKIIQTLKSLKSDKAGHTNTINIDCAIEITKTIKY